MKQAKEWLETTKDYPTRSLAHRHDKPLVHNISKSANNLPVLI
jgi:hypothetical protein